MRAMHVFCAGVFSYLLLPRWFAESARWLVIAGRPDQAVKELKRVAKINRKKEEGDKLNIEVRLDLREAESFHRLLGVYRHVGQTGINWHGYTHVVWTLQMYTSSTFGCSVS